MLGHWEPVAVTWVTGILAKSLQLSPIFLQLQRQREELVSSYVPVNRIFRWRQYVTIHTFLGFGLVLG